MPKINLRNRDAVLVGSFTFILFAIAPLYYQPNIGGRGLSLTFNISSWFAASLFIAVTLLITSIRKRLRLPRYYLCFVAVPAVIILSSLITGTAQPVPFFFREIYIVGGLLFFFALFQFDLKQQQVEWVLLIIALSTLTHSSIGIVQITQPELLAGWFATHSDATPRGIFQQVNVNASFLATGIAITLFLLSRPVAKRFSSFIAGVLVISLFFSTFVVVSSGSRTALLSLALLLPLMVLARRKQLLANKRLFVIALMVIASGALLGKTGMERSLAHKFNLAQGLSGGARVNIYRIALELVAQKPIRGHGIGNFLRVWNLQSSDYFKRHPDARLVTYLTHPHNELIFWVIEGGMVIILGIVAAMIAVALALIRCGPARAAGYIAMLLPITLHTQLELPFYISSIHWFLWLFLIFIVMRHQVFTTTMAISSSATRLIQATGIIALLGSLYFLGNSTRAQADIYNYVHQTPGESPYLQTALANHYFSHQAESLAMRGQLYNAVTQHNSASISEFIDWSLKRIRINPELKRFEDLIVAYDALNEPKQKCNVIAFGLQNYAQNAPLQQLWKSCAQTR